MRLALTPPAVVNEPPPQVAAAVESEGADVTVHPRAQGAPGAAVPLGDVVGADAPGGRELAAGVQVAAAVERQGQTSLFIPEPKALQVLPFHLAM